MKGLMLCLLLGGVMSGEAADYRAPGVHPALLLTPARLRLLQRERGRQSPRWEQFASLVAGKAAMPEASFAEALYFQVSGDKEAARRAIAWALGEGADLRQLALVFDWCQAALTEKESGALAAKLAGALSHPPAGNGVEEARSRAFAAIALADASPAASERELKRIVEEWWQGKVLAGLNAGEDVLPRSGRYALFELLHALRDNLGMDLRESARRYFSVLPVMDLLSYYPAPYEAPENEYRIPATAAGGTDTRAAESARAADFAMAAYDTTAAGNQFLQGWLLHDLFVMHGPYGAPYEFLWANPYQPGLSYYHAPRAAHDGVVGQFFVRSGWEDDARWAGFFGGKLQVFAGGKPETMATTSPKQIGFGDTVVAVGGGASSLVIAERVTRVFLMGLKPRQSYRVQAGSEKQEERTDPGGIMDLQFPDGFRGTIRFSAQR